MIMTVKHIVMNVIMIIVLFLTPTKLLLYIVLFESCKVSCRISKGSHVVFLLEHFILFITFIVKNQTKGTHFG